MIIRDLRQFFMRSGCYSLKMNADLLFMGYVKGGWLPN